MKYKITKRVVKQAQIVAFIEADSMEAALAVADKLPKPEQGFSEVVSQEARDVLS